jgi:hypothetical protein
MAVSLQHFLCARRGKTRISPSVQGLIVTDKSPVNHGGHNALRQAQEHKEHGEVIASPAGFSFGTKFNVNNESEAYR